MTDRDLSLSQFGAGDRELLAAVFEHEAVNLFIHLDDCEDGACTGCDPEHLAKKAAAKPTAREQLFRRVAGAFVDETKANVLLDAYRAEVLAEAEADRTRLTADLHRQIEHQKAGKARWRSRAEKAEQRLKGQRGNVLAEVARLLASNTDTPPALLIERLRVEGGVR
jgi:hypothetical protein